MRQGQRVTPADRNDASVDIVTQLVRELADNSTGGTVRCKSHHRCGALCVIIAATDCDSRAQVLEPEFF